MGKRKEERRMGAAFIPGASDQPRPKSAAEGLFRPAEEETVGPARPASLFSPAPQPARESGGFDISQWFDIPKMWEHVLKARRDPKFRTPAGIVVPIVQVGKPTRDIGTAAEEVATFFRLPPDIFRGMTPQQAWERVIGPFTKRVQDALNSTRPFGIRGELRFEVSPDDGSFGLGYYER